MKLLALSIAFLSASALACPDGASKDAMAPAMSKPSTVAAKPTPKSLATASAQPSAKAPEKVAAKSTEQRKTAPL
jgi:hypothetical protein